MKSQKFLKQSKGKYDMLEMFRLPTDECHEIGEYSGPIEIIEIPGKGRGVVATADISPGQLVSVTKAFAIGFGKETEFLRMLKLTKKILEKLHFPDEDTRREFETLPACAAPNDPPSTWVFKDTDVPAEQDEVSIEVHMRVIDNMFVNYRAKPIANGIWTSAAFFNNDCIDANVHVEHCGDVMIIRAVNHIQKGQELTVTYYSPDEPNRRKLLREDRNFECKCRLCLFEIEESEETTNEIQELLTNFQEQIDELRNDETVWKHLQQDRIDLADILENLVLSTGNISAIVERQVDRVTLRNQETPKDKLKTLMEIFRRIAALRSENSSLNVAMFEPRLLYFAMQLFLNQYYGECVEVIETARHTLKSAEGLISRLLLLEQLIISCFLKLGDFNQIIKWVGIIKEDLVRAYGTVEILRVIDNVLLMQFESSEIGVDFFSL